MNLIDENDVNLEQFAADNNFLPTDWINLNCNLWNEKNQWHESKNKRKKNVNLSTLNINESRAFEITDDKGTIFFRWGKMIAITWNDCL